MPGARALTSSCPVGVANYWKQAFAGGPSGVDHKDGSSPSETRAGLAAAVTSRLRNRGQQVRRSEVSSKDLRVKPKLRIMWCVWLRPSGCRWAGFDPSASSLAFSLLRKFRPPPRKPEHINHHFAAAAGAPSDRKWNQDENRRRRRQMAPVPRADHAAAPRPPQTSRNRRDEWTRCGQRCLHAGLSI